MHSKVDRPAAPSHLAVGLGIDAPFVLGVAPSMAKKVSTNQAKVQCAGCTHRLAAWNSVNLQTYRPTDYRPIV